jgi:hypothetical protein
MRAPPQFATGPQIDLGSLKVKSFEWSDPRVIISLESTAAEGLRIIGTSTKEMAKLGWTQDTLHAGGRDLWASSVIIGFATVLLADGRKLSTGDPLYVEPPAWFIPFTPPNRFAQKGAK